MSSALQSAITTILQNNYVTLAILTAVVYDYVLIFSREIEYIWNKPWTWVSTLFIFVRYVGLYNLIIPTILGSSFLPGPAKTYVFTLSSLSALPTAADVYYSAVSEILYILNGWIFVIFLGAADLVMILRVWALYHRSRLILGALLASFSVEIIFTIILAAINGDPRNLSATTSHIFHFSVCGATSTAPKWTNVAVALQIAHAGAVCILVIAQFLKQSFQMYRATKQWQLNRYVNLLVKQGIFYFLGIFLYTLINLLLLLRNGLAPGWQAWVILQYVPVYTLTPRFILSVRALYAHEVKRERGGGIDTGFGLPSLGGRSAGVILFADAEQNEEGMEAIEEIPLEVGTTQQE
ncbi:hypothetical protein EV363DRAFT_1213141 [Boletus edulis]|nr:hypothetical protein EV363DRAFT_1213141 [Boletus edulis]